MTTWNPSDAEINGYTLSNRLTLVGNDRVISKSIRGVSSHTSGKVYFELFAHATGGNEYQGLADISFDLTGGLGRTGVSASIQYGVNIYTSQFTSNYGTLNAWVGPGGTIGLAVDFDAGKIWVASNGAWVEGSDPASALLPIISFVPGSLPPMFPALYMSQMGEYWQLKTRVANQKYAPPAGFSAWDPPDLAAPISGFNPYDTFCMTVSDDGLSAVQVANIGALIYADGRPVEPVGPETRPVQPRATNDFPGNVRSVNSHSHGKYHVEFYNVQNVTLQDALGFANSLFNISTNLGADAAGNSTSWFYYGGWEWVVYIQNGPETGNTAWGITEGGDFAIEIDFDAKLIWAKDITAGTGWNPWSPIYASGFPIPGLADGAYFIDFGMWRNTSATNLVSATVNFGATPFKTTPQAGFAAWDPIAIGTGDMPVSVTLSGALSAVYPVVGGLGPVVDLAGTMSLILPLAGDVAPQVNFAGLPISFQADFAGEYDFTITFAGDQIHTTLDAVGDVAFQINFAGALNAIYALAGDLAPSIPLNGDLTLSLPVTGGMAAQVAFAATELLAEPLWEPSSPGDPVDWDETELCNG